jgi:methylated-DNA-[protein]-cysteine S-methyltransferase
MPPIECASFETTLGRGAVAWGPGGVVAVSFPSPVEGEALQAIRRRAPAAVEGAPPSDIARLIADIAALCAGEKRDFASARLDLSGIGDFERRVYAETRRIPPGETKSYGDIACALGDVAFSQRIGQALGRNPFPIVIPCHRVIGVDGRMVGFSAPGGAAAKMRLLKIEGGLPPDLFDL